LGSLAPRVYDRLVARILLATDGSAEAKAATQVAVEQAEARAPSFTWSTSGGCPTS
jgi:hypothetical protein